MASPLSYLEASPSHPVPAGQSASDAPAIGRAPALSPLFASPSPVRRPAAAQQHRFSADAGGGGERAAGGERAGGGTSSVGGHATYSAASSSGHATYSAASSSSSRNSIQRIGALSSAAFAAETLFESVGGSAVPAIGSLRDQRLTATIIRPPLNRARGCAGRVVSRVCDAQEQDRLRACLACWTLTVQNAQRTSATWRDGSSQQQQQQQQQQLRKHLRQSHRRQTSPEFTRATELRTALRAWLLLVSERRRQRLNFRAADMLARRDQASLMQECVFAWNAVAAQRQAAQVQALQGRLERADAECCALRSQGEGLHAETQRWRAEVEASQARTDWAEAELLRRSGHEFARLRELQLEFSALQAEAKNPKVCSTCSMCTNSQQQQQQQDQEQRALIGSKLESHCSAKLAPAAAKTGLTITAARSLALSFAAAITQVWLKLYLSAWCAQASARGLVLSLVAQCAAAGDAVQYSRTFAAWQFALHQSRLLRSTKRLASSNSRAQATVSLARSVLGAWNSVVRETRELDGAMSASLDAGSPLSGQTYCSAVCWSPAEGCKPRLVDTMRMVG